MFDTLHFETNKTLIQEANKLISEHNTLSYKKANLLIQNVEYKFIRGAKSNNQLSDMLIAFYEEYSTQMYVFYQLKEIVDSTSYTTDSLAMNIDLSSDSIGLLLSKLSATRDKLEEITERILNNVHKQAEISCEYIAKTCDENTDIKNVLDVMFSCMIQTGLGSKIDVDESLCPFISVGAKLIELLFKYSKLTPSIVSYIKQENDKLKQKILKISNIRHQKLNKLQTFGLTPEEGPNITLADLIHKLFGLSMPIVDSIQTDSENIEKALQLLTADTGLSTGMIVIVSRNMDMYFDMTSLFNVSQPLGSKGVTSEMVKMFDLIKLGDLASSTESSLITINVDIDKTQMAYVVWTNNYRTFKYKSSPIDNFLIQKLLRKAPSSIIESYNAVFEQMIQDNQVNDAIMFNKVKYMSFTEEGSEEQFLDELQQSLVSYVSKHMNETVVSQAFTDGLFDIIDAAKDKLGIMRQQLPAHCHIIYGNIAASIVGKIKKELSVDMTKDKLEEAIKMIVKTNDNIYSRVIAGYYLHIA